VVGDWEGDGRDAVGVYRPSTAQFVIPGYADVAPVEPVAKTAEPADDELLPALGAPPAGPLRSGAPKGRKALPLVGDWNGVNLVTRAELRAMFGPGAKKAVERAQLQHLSLAMMRAGVVTPARKAAFLATIYHESAFRADALERGTGRYRGRGFIQLTGEGNYRRAGEDLGIDLVRRPHLARNPLVSAAIAGWYWTRARNINAAADRLDMGAVNIAIGYQPTRVRDRQRCATFERTLKWLSGGKLPKGVNCQRTPEAAALAMTPPEWPGGGSAGLLAATPVAPGIAFALPAFVAPTFGLPSFPVVAPTTTTTDAPPAAPTSGSRPRPSTPRSTTPGGTPAPTTAPPVDPTTVPPPTTEPPPPPTTVDPPTTVAPDPEPETTTIPETTVPDPPPEPLTVEAQPEAETVPTSAA
jgi:putative chitinase